MFFDLVALGVNVGCVYYAARLARKTEAEVGRLERSTGADGWNALDVPSRNEAVLEANALWEMCRTLGPRASKLGGLVSVAHLFASVGSFERTETLIFLGTSLVLGMGGYAYTRASFRRNESRLRRVRDQIRKSSRP